METTAPKKERERERMKAEMEGKESMTGERAEKNKERDMASDDVMEIERDSEKVKFLLRLGWYLSLTVECHKVG